VITFNTKLGLTPSVNFHYNFPVKKKEGSSYEIKKLGARIENP
jgi:hypothetical protein